jgi:hypothetical protein
MMRMGSPSATVDELPRVTAVTLKAVSDLCDERRGGGGRSKQ